LSNDKTSSAKKGVFSGTGKKGNKPQHHIRSTIAGIARAENIGVNFFLEKQTGPGVRTALGRESNLGGRMGGGNVVRIEEGIVTRGRKEATRESFGGLEKKSLV